MMYIIWILQGIDIFLILFFSYKDDFKRQKLTFAMIIFMYVIEFASKTIRIKSNIEPKKKTKNLTIEIAFTHSTWLWWSMASLSQPPWVSERGF